jgi:hypothetical protein
MKQPIAGVMPTDLGEAPLMTVWPSIGAFAAGRWVGGLCALPIGIAPFTLGKIMALATIPVSLVVYFWRLMPGYCRRYAVTTRRIVIRRGLTAVEDRWINLDEFDEIRIEVLPGQTWLRCADVSFRRDGHEMMRLAGVSHPEPFRQACLKAQTALVSVGRVIRQQMTAAQAGAV